MPSGEEPSSPPAVPAAPAISLGEVEWTSPVDPPAMLDASAFEQHLVNAHARGKREVPDHFYQVPVYYKMSPLTVIGPDAEAPGRAASASWTTSWSSRW